MTGMVRYNHGMVWYDYGMVMTMAWYDWYGMTKGWYGMA
jgi:hypothetical protein